MAVAEQPTAELLSLPVRDCEGQTIRFRNIQLIIDNWYDIIVQMGTSEYCNVFVNIVVRMPEPCAYLFLAFWGDSEVISVYFREVLEDYDIA